MSEEFRTPDPGEGIHEVEIVEILVAEGDRVEEGDSLFAVESDKATAEVPASFDGVVESIEVAQGDVVEVGAVLLTYGTGSNGDRDAGEAAADRGEADESEDAAVAQSEDAAGRRGRKDRKKGRKGAREADKDRRHEEDDDRAASATGGKSSAERAADDDVEASPATRRLARELDVNLAEVAGSGPGGRVLGRDVRNSARRRDGPEPRITVPPLPDFSRWGEVGREPLRGVRRAAARHMALSWHEIPHVSHTCLADVTRLESFRREHAEQPDGKLTLAVLVVKALAAALRRYPRFNASLDTRSDEVVYKKYCHIGVAVATDDGLVVPVLRDVDRKPLVELADDLARLSEAARSRRLAADDMRGGCISVTNVGGIGGAHFTPLINYPEAAILGVGAMREVPALVRNEAGQQRLTARLELPLIVAFDHRLNDGMDAAGFANAIAEALSDPERMLLAA